MGAVRGGGVKRRELGLIFAAPVAHFDAVGATVRRKLRGHTAFLAFFEQPVTRPICHVSTVSARRPAHGVRCYGDNQPDK